MNNFIKTIVLLSACLIPALQASEIHTRTLSVSINGDGKLEQLKSSLCSDRFSGEGGLFLQNEYEEPVPAIFSSATRVNGILVVKKNVPGGTVEETFRPVGDYIHYQIKISNHSKERHFRLLGLAVPLPKVTDWKYWNGISETALTPEKRVRDTNMNGKFPMSCIYGNEAGLGLGIMGDQYFSQLESGLRDGNKFYYSVQVILDPGQVQSIDFVLYDFPAPWKYLNALQKYYDFFPELFSPASGSNPTIYGIGGYVRSRSDRTYMEECRRFHFAWDWVYAPFQKTGYWYPRVEEWDVKKGTAASFPPQPRLVYNQLQKYQEDITRRFATASQGCVAGFYIIPRSCDVNIAREFYTDSYLLTITGETVPTGAPKGGDEKTLAMFASGNRFGERTIGDIEKIATHYQPGGFAFDEAWGTAKCFGGVGVENSPGKAFIEDVAYSLDAVPYARCMDKVHEFRDRNGYRMSVISNSPYIYMVAFRSDAVMHENPYYLQEAELMKMRVLLGRKPISMWEGFPLSFNEQSDPEQVEKSLREAIEGTILFGLSTGVLPSSHQAKGYPAICRALPVLISLTRAGWQPVPAIQPCEGLDAARFGKDVSTFLSLVNRGKTDFTGEIVVDNKELGDGAFFFTRVTAESGIKALEKSSLARCLVSSQHTVLQVSIPAASALLLKAAGKIMLDSTQGTISVNAEFENPETLWMQVFCESDCTADLQLARPDSASFASVTLDNKQGSSLREIPWRETRKIMVKFSPDVFFKNPDGMLEFPFLHDGKPSFVVVVGDQALPAELKAADRIAAYFEYYYSQTERQALSVSVRKAAEINLNENQNLVLISGAGGNDLVKRLAAQAYPFESVSSKGLIQCLSLQQSPRQVLYLAGDVDLAALALLKVLDRKYVYYGEPSAKAFKYLQEKGAIQSSTFE